jgi:hypothetical protein
MNQLNAGPNNIKTKVVVITPAYAEQLLGRNTKNRAVRPTRVKEFVDIIKKDEWKVTHQGVALDQAGVLVDGQHRLMAIQAAGKSVRMMVTEGLDDNARLAVDTHAKRTYADILNIDRIIIAPIVELARIRYSSASVRPEQVLGFCAVLLPISERFHAEVKTHARRVMGSGPVKAGAFLRIAQGESPEYVHELYRAIAEVQTDLPPIAQSFMRQIVDGTLGKGRAQFAKSHMVFGKENAAVQKIQIKKLDARMADLRDQIKDVVGL